MVRDTGNGPELGMSVSGEVVFDEMGRLIGQYQPYFDASAPNVLAPPPQDPILAVIRDYDVLDRQTAERTPIAPTPGGPESYSFATTTTTYSIGKINTTARLMATISDPNVIARGSSPSLPGYARDEYRGVRGHLLRVVEKNRLSGSGVVSTLPTSYGYNALGELTSVTDSNGNITVATYDTAGQIVTLISPDAGRTDYLFDIAGNLAAKQTANLAYGFQRIYYDYDYNRLKKIDYPNSADVTFTYGAWTEAGPLSFYRASRIKQETSEAGTKSFRYELLGNINEETWSLNSLGSGPPVERTFRYNYDSFGRLLAVHYPGASEEVVNYSYDVGGNLDAVTGITGTGIITPYVQHIGYDEFEQKTSITLGNGITTYYSYDPYTRRLAGVSSSHRDPALVQAGAPARPFQQITYAYDPVGNLLEVANNAPVDPSQTGAVKVGPVTETFTYDDLYQLKTADGILQESETQQHRYGISFTYDLLSNVTSKTQLSETDTLANGAITSTTTRNEQTYTSTFTYPAGSRPHAVAQLSDVVPGSGTVARTFTYDRNGNQETWQRTSGPSLSRTTTYNDDNRVVSVSQNGSILQEALYDGAGQRLVKRANQSAETAYFGQYLTVRDNIPTTKHILAGGMRVASKFVPNDANEECAACPDRPSVTYFHSDHLGSTSFATDEEQTLLSRQHYFPSGELWLDQTNSLTAAQQPYLFSGKELDVETGLYYFGARYYDPRAGLWTTPDPILLQYMLGAPNSGVHFPRNLALYTYAINNPVIVQDSDGRAWWTKALKVGKALYKGGDMAMAFADAIENYNTVTNANASTGERVWAGVQLLSEVAPISVSDIKDAGRIVGVVDKIGDAGKGVKQAGNVGDAGKRLPADPPKMLPERAGPTGQISPSEVSGKTPAQIDARARELGLEARGPDPAGGRGAYIDPQTGKQRILSHPNGSPPHGHVNNPAGERIGSDGRVVPPESPEAHLPIKVE